MVPWPSEGVHRISVNNFGFGGSNAHVILEDAHGYMSSRDLIGKHQSPVVSTKSEIIAKGSVAREGTEQPRIFLITAVSEVSGLQQAKALGQYLRDHRDHGSDELLGDIAYTLAEHRSKFPLKAAFAANSLSQLADALTNSNSRFQTTPQAEHVAFIFTGQGAQWHGMGRELFACYPVFRKSLESADQYIQDLGACWSLLGKSVMLNDLSAA